MKSTRKYLLWIILFLTFVPAAIYGYISLFLRLAPTCLISDVLTDEIIWGVSNASCDFWWEFNPSGLVESIPMRIHPRLDGLVAIEVVGIIGSEITVHVRNNSGYYFYGCSANSCS